MTLVHALYFLLAVAAFALVTERWRVSPLLAGFYAVAGFALASGMSISLLGKGFGAGFALTLAGLGLAVVAGGLMTSLAETTGASAWLSRVFAPLRRKLGGSALVAVPGLVLGLAASPGAAFAVLTPLRRAIAGSGSALAFGLALSAGQGLLFPAPVTGAAVAILGADWHLVLRFGIPVAVVTVAFGAAFASWVAPADVAAPAAPLPKAGGRIGLMLILVSLALAGMLLVQSVGDLPSEPWGGGPNRELVLGVGRPFILLLLGVGGLLAVTTRFDRYNLAERGWPESAFTVLAPLLLLVGLSGGLQTLVQDSHLPDMLAEKVIGPQFLSWQLGLAVPFLVALVIKAAQGSSLVAVITAAGMVQPLLPALGLDQPNGRALAVLAVGSGAMALSHLNDGLFWLVGDAAHLRPAQTLARFSLGTLLQALVALALLVLLHMAVG